MIAASIAAACHRFLVGPSIVLATIVGISITILTTLCTSTLFSVFLAPVQLNSYFAALGLVIVLAPGDILTLLIGGCAGVLLSYLSNRKRRNTPLNTDTHLPPA